MKVVFAFRGNVSLDLDVVSSGRGRRSGVFRATAFRANVANLEALAASVRAADDETDEDDGRNDTQEQDGSDRIENVLAGRRGRRSTRRHYGRRRAGRDQRTAAGWVGSTRGGRVQIGPAGVTIRLRQGVGMAAHVAHFGHVERTPWRRVGVVDTGGSAGAAGRAVKMNHAAWGSRRVCADGVRQATVTRCKPTPAVLPGHLPGEHQQDEAGEDSHCFGSSQPGALWPIILCSQDLSSQCRKWV